MAHTKDTKLYQGHATPENTILRELPVEAIAGTNIYLRALDATPTNIILRDPTVSDATGIVIAADAGSYSLTGTDATFIYTPVAAPAVAVVSGAGGGGRRKEPALIAPFITWGKAKKPKKPEQIAEVASVIQQVTAKADAPYLDPGERDVIAARLLAAENLAQMRRIRTIEDMLARIESERREMDDEDLLLLVS